MAEPPLGPTARIGLVIDIGLKLALVGLLLFAVANPRLPQFEGKAVTGRAVSYPIAALLVPAGWWLFARKRRYPIAADILLVLPFLIDTLGNTADLYDRVEWWDDANHFVNWAILTAGFMVAIRGLRLAWWNAWALGAGVGAITAILWELLEFVTFIRNSPERETAYTDTLGDLALGLLGSVLAAALVAALSLRSRSEVRQS